MSEHLTPEERAILAAYPTYHICPLIIFVPLAVHPSDAGEGPSVMTLLLAGNLARKDVVNNAPLSPATPPAPYCWAGDETLLKGTVKLVEVELDVPSIKKIINTNLSPPAIGTVQ